MVSKYLFEFLESTHPEAAQNAKKMEELMFEEPSSAIVKARVFVEQILTEVFKYEYKEAEAPYLSSLYEKIAYLAKEGVFEQEIQRSFDTIRFSGNKAAHGNFDDIAEAYKLHKEMFKIGVWFYEVYSSSTEEQLKIPVYEIPRPRPKENIEDLVKKQILELLGSGNFDPEPTSIPDHKIENKGTENEQSSFTRDLNKGESYLVRELSRLKDSSQEAIENASQFSMFKNYLHVDRKIQLDLEKILETNKSAGKGNLVLLCGSVGDGKSHLLAYLNQNKPDLIREYTIFNDATESFSPNKNAMETLEEVLKGFSDEMIDTTNEKIILAINMGVLHNFINTEHKNYTYDKLREFVEQSDLFSQNITTHFNSNNLDLLSFGDYHSYELTENGPVSNFYSTIIEKIFDAIDENPFYLALKEDEQRNLNTMVHDNYKFLQNEFVQHQIVQLIIQAIVKQKLVISARAFLNFIADILIPDEVLNKQLISEFDVLDYSVPNLIFNRKERSVILNAMTGLDPIHTRSKHIDEVIIKLNTLNEWDTIIKENIQDQVSESWLTPFKEKSNLSGHTFNVFLESFVRNMYLTNKGFSEKLLDDTYINFIKNLYYFNKKEKSKVRDFYDEMKISIFKWKGSPKRDYIYMDRVSDKYRLAQKLNLRPTIEHLQDSLNETLDTFKSSILLGYRDEKGEKKLFLEIDYKLYQLLSKVQEGYRPNKKDEEDAINFKEFVDKLMAFGDKKKEMLIHFPVDNRSYMVKQDDFGSFVFERE
ncbi:DNA phosphorothioation-dependent restriction protein DptF [Cytobacillus gottheilii]|uniref:DNA phosphorothioation-dependent restriction protein DptF n=1 Tax=Cytobacillus gottheilii TaxID=859144 RepID=UPI003CE7D1A8